MTKAGGQRGDGERREKLAVPSLTLIVLVLSFMQVQRGKDNKSNNRKRSPSTGENQSFWFVKDTRGRKEENYHLVCVVTCSLNVDA